MSKVLKVLGSEGHTEVTYRDEVEEEIKKAQAIFRENQRKGYASFAMEPAGEGKPKEGRRIHSFDRKAEEILQIPPMVGG